MEILTQEKQQDKEDKFLIPFFSQNEYVSMNNAIIRSTINKLPYKAIQLWYLIAYKSLPVLNQTDTIRIRVKEACEYLNINPKNYIQLNGYLTDIQNTKLEYNITGKNPDRNWLRTPLVSSTGIVDGEIICTFDSIMRANMLNPQFFTRLTMELIRSFSNKYVFATFSDLMAFKRKTLTSWYKTYSVDEYRYYLQLKESEYKEFRLLNDKVIKPSLKEINEISPIEINVKFTKEKKRVTQITFYATLKNEYIKTINNIDNDNQLSIDNIIDISNNDKNTIISSYEVKSSKIKQFCIDNGYPESFIYKFRSKILESGVLEEEFESYIEFLIKELKEIESKSIMKGAMTNSLKEIRYFNEFKNKNTKITTNKNESDEKAKQIIEEETNKFISQKYQDYLQEELYTFFIQEDFEEVFKGLIEELRDTGNVNVQTVVRRNNNNIDLSLLESRSLRYEIFKKFDLSNMGFQVISEDDFIKTSMLEPDFQKVIKKFRKDIFMNIRSQIYGNSPYNNLTDIQKRLGLS